MVSNQIIEVLNEICNKFYDMYCAIRGIASGILLNIVIVMAVCKITTMIACKTLQEKSGAGYDNQIHERLATWWR